MISSAPNSAPPVFSAYRVRRVYFLAQGLGAFVLLVGGVVFLIHAFFDLLVTPETAATWPWLAAFLLILPGCWLAVLAYINAKKAVMVSPTGLEVQDWAGKRRWPWQRVSAFYVGSAYRVVSSVQQLVLDRRYGRFKSMGNTIQQMVAPRQYERMREMLAKKQPVPLGALTVLPGGLAFDGQKYPWAALDAAALGSTHLYFRLKNRRILAVPIEKIANLEAFLRLLACDFFLDLM